MMDVLKYQVNDYRLHRNLYNSFTVNLQALQMQVKFPTLIPLVLGESRSYEVQVSFTLLSL